MNFDLLFYDQFFEKKIYTGVDPIGHLTLQLGSEYQRLSRTKKKVISKNYIENYGSFSSDPIDLFPLDQFNE